MMLINLKHCTCTTAIIIHSQAVERQITECIHVAINLWLLMYNVRKEFNFDVLVPCLTWSFIYPILDTIILNIFNHIHFSATSQ